MLTEEPEAPASLSAGTILPSAKRVCLAPPMSMPSAGLTTMPNSGCSPMPRAGLSQVVPNSNLTPVSNSGYISAMPCAGQTPMPRAGLPQVVPNSNLMPMSNSGPSLAMPCELGMNWRIGVQFSYIQKTCLVSLFFSLKDD